MIAPRIHTGGTWKKDLQQALLDAARAIDNAIEALQSTAPHARDYYPISADAHSQACKEFKARRLHLATVRTEIWKIYEAIDRGETEC